MTLMTAMTMNCKGSLYRVRPSLLRRETVLGAGSLRSARPTKGDADAKSAPSTLLQIHPLYSYRYSSPSLWGLSSRYFERASIIRWQGIRAGAPPMLLFARNPRAAERDTPSTKPARDYPTPTRSIAPIKPQEVAINRLDKAQRSIGPLPIIRRMLPITMEEPDRRSG